MLHRAKKSLGQNFLKSEPILDRIVETANIAPSDTILEIGPGLGALTKKMVGVAKRVIAVEKDDSLYSILTENFAESIKNKEFELISGDILEFDPENIRKSLKGGENSYKLIANIPYNITGAIIEKFLSASFQPNLMVLMVQKEVAERIVAKNKKTGGPGKESILSIAVKAYGEPSYICTVKAGNFVPAPSIDSAVIKIDTISRKNFTNKHHEEVFFQIVKTGFAHKRKTLAGNLKNVLEPEMVDAGIQAAGLRPAARAEDLSIKTWHTLAHFFYEKTYLND